MGKPNQARAHAKRAAKRDEDQMVENINAAVHPKIAKLDLQMKDRSQRTFPKWTNRQRTLVFSSRGISFQVRHLLQDLRVLMPHSKKDVKMDRKDRLNEIVPEICEMKNCNNCIYIEMRKKKDVYMWMSKMPMGPSVKFLVTDIYTMSELKLTGNCLRGSRPLLQFDQAFDSQPHYQLLKEILFQTFATPNQHPKSKAFVDHIFSFSILEDRIWFRNYQVTWKEPGKVGKDSEMVLTEIGPRFCLQVIRIFEGTFGGPTLFENADYVSPNMQRSMLRDEAAAKYKNKVMAREQHIEHLASVPETRDDVINVFRDAEKAVAQARNASEANADEDEDEEEEVEVDEDEEDEDEEVEVDEDEEDEEDDE